MAPHARLFERNAQIQQMFASGETAASIAAMFSLTTVRVYQLAGPRERVAKPPAKRKAKIRVSDERKAERAERRLEAFLAHPRTIKVVAMYRQGIVLEKIGQTLGFTREYARQVLRKAGVLPDEGGRARIKAIKGDKRVAIDAIRNGKHLEKYRMPYAEYKALPTKIKNIFRWQANHSRHRGIGWELKFGDWYRIWMDSGKWEQRGRTTGKYVMSRIRDDGPYAIGNVHIQTCNENGQEAVKKWRGKTKANPGVFCLYPGSTRPYYVKHGKNWEGRYATEAEAIAAKKALQASKPLRSGAFGRGRGWTFLRKRKTRPYQMQGPGGAHGRFATQAEAEDAYRLAVLKHKGLYRPALDFTDGAA